MNNESTIIDITLNLFIIHCRQEDIKEKHYVQTIKCLVHVPLCCCRKRRGYSKYACVVYKGHIYFQFSPASVSKYSPESHQSSKNILLG